MSARKRASRMAAVRRGGGRPVFAFPMVPREDLCFCPSPHLHRASRLPALPSPVGVKEERLTNPRERRRCDTACEAMSIKISPMPSLTNVLTNEYLYATLTRFCCSRPIRWGRSILETPRSGRERAVSVMTHLEARSIEADASRALHSVQPPSTGLQNSNRNKPGNRNARNSSFIRNLIFSTRNKMGGGAKAESEEFTNVCAEKPSPCTAPNIRLALRLKCSAAALSAASYNFESVSRPTPGRWSSSIRPPASGLQILIATPANRNALNSLDVNKTYRSNRNKTRGYRSPFQAGGMHRDL